MAPFHQPESESESTVTSVYTHTPISGNASDHVKTKLDALLHIPTDKPHSPLFASKIMNSMVLTEVSIVPNAEEPSRMEGKCVMEIVAFEDMMNLADTVHGGALAYFIDFCSSLALVTLDLTQNGDYALSVSQAINIVFHSPAALGEKLRIINRSVTSGSRSATGRTEIWNVNHRRLVASGVHIKMQPSKAKNKL
ncbi:hypothetical protein D9757_001848 [Collybiopsis confluens]|uniref:Thioesterase domain-containing protein n=1 Tax=Collybiopsis confluens TaxID=2823264 RepID=A0A8H5MFK7_9AGAR|nr:hypothetical protein D9757_001840 [Collybiopsis confluens]KAF5391930.1 hypothetical protein D9757_001848 [Collybiopsis confluens]